MTDIRVFTGAGQPNHKTAGDLAERLKAVVYEYADIPVATAIGALEIAKIEILQEQQ